MIRVLGGSYVHVAAIVALRMRANGARDTTDSVQSLARWVGMSTASMRRALDWLVGIGIVLERREARKGAGQGVAWSWRRSALSFEEWPEELRSLSTSSTRRGVPGEHLLPEKRRSQGTEEVLTSGGRGALATRHNPEVPPDSFQRGDGSLALRRGGREVAGLRVDRGMRHVGQSLEDVQAMLRRRSAAR